MLSMRELIGRFEEDGIGCALVSDDADNWAVVSDGMQNVPDDPPQDIHATFFISEAEWKPSIREALEAWLHA